MDFVEDFRVGQECTDTGFCEEIDPPATIFGAWIVSGIGIAEDSSAESDKALVFSWLQGFRHPGYHNAQASILATGEGGLSIEYPIYLLNFGDEDFKRTNRQSNGRFCCSKAFSTGKQNIQVAIFDLANAREIQLKLFL